MGFHHWILAQQSSWPFLREVQLMTQYGSICMDRLFGIAALFEAFARFRGTAIGTSSTVSESLPSSPASGLLSSAAFAISSSSSLSELQLVVLSDSSSSLRAAKTAEVGFGAMLGCLVCCGRVSVGAGKVLVDFLGAMVLEQTKSDGEQEIALKLD